MFPTTTRAIDQAVHNIVNLRLYPTCALRLGQSDHVHFQDADIRLERTGNLYEYGWDAITYAYRISGKNFTVNLLATWPDEDQATARVRVIGLHSDDEAALEAWLDRAVIGLCPSHDMMNRLGTD